MTADVREEAPGHRIDPRGHCRCGWESRDAAFHWSEELPVVDLPAAEQGR
ncbi:hypothetical protein [Actinomycetospora termitidis]|uniref:Uncharacterized protein n=1 Tax=Actinomycetospora termitidis TaxID=3053470 RepID=A0ABT7M7R9_9PSEU|nr:hypothetical protein [Actinomycetospora sp. Odt1-22]MDL5156491.1 hypothetical protein [Actinomycetospora sp. Odt1-22]